MPEEAERARREGPVTGTCPSCGARAHARTDWLELEPSRERAVLVLGPQQRHRLVELLRDHLDRLAARVAAGGLDTAEPWMLRPHWRFDDGGSVTAVRGIAEVASSAPVRTPVPAAVPAMDSEDTARRRAPRDSGVPHLVGSQWPHEEEDSDAQDTYLATLRMDRAAGQDEDVVTVELDLDEAGRALWGQAALQVRPIHLRAHGYPLLGVRLVASYLGRVALIDGIIDVASQIAADVFSVLSRRFRVQLVFRGEASSIIRREVSARDLERNAALCLESARAALARREHPREAFARALDDLRETARDERLRGAEHSLVAGAYRHLISPRETWVALEHLEAASDKQNLAHLLEVDGLSVDEYEAIRRRVLVASVEHGLCAPRRFWRRLIASGLADDFADYASRLAKTRSEADQDGDDLDADQRSAAWAQINELCDIKELEYPPELARKLGIELHSVVEHADAVRERSEEASGQRAEAGAGDEGLRNTLSAAGEIQAQTRVGISGNLRDQLRDVGLRLRVATASLANGGTPEAVEAVFEVLEELDEEELLAIVPSLAELGTQVVPALHDKLESSSQQVRQAAVILLGIARDGSSISPLLRSLTRESSRVWVDVARAIGGLGTSALERLCAVLRQSSRGDNFPIDHRELLARVGRAFAEVVIAEGGKSGIAHDAVEALSQSSETDIALAAARALATLEDVSVAGAQVRGERSLPDITQLRGFARRAYEAIMVPELDILDEEVEAELL